MSNFLSDKQKNFLEAIKKLGNISLACKQTKIDRKTHYNWLNSNSFYKQEIDKIPHFTNQKFHTSQAKNSTLRKPKIPQQKNTKTLNNKDSEKIPQSKISTVSTPKKEQQNAEIPLTDQQKNFLEVLEKTLGVVSTACTQTGIDRKTHYNWLNSNSLYKEEVELIKDKVVDFSESRLLKKINEGDTTCILFHLKCLGKSRGYIERHELKAEMRQIKLKKPVWFTELEN